MELFGGFTTGQGFLGSHGRELGSLVFLAVCIIFLTVAFKVGASGIFVQAGGTTEAPSIKVVVAIQGRLMRNSAHVGYTAGLQA